ncbi:hypothetical protein J3459_018520 [Metarhizium acridum]|nr:hypothetical protein J3459_018520 [Metarhizium acridum]
MAAFSSRGPTRPDGRIKPDVVAPGTTILSARSSQIVPDTTANLGDTANDVRDSTARALPNGEFGPVRGLRPNPSSGFGRVNLANSLRNIVANQESAVYGFQDVTGDQSLGMDGRHRGEHAVTVDIPQGSPAALTLKVTLVWTDFPGEKAAERPRLGRSLDLY